MTNNDTLTLSTLESHLWQAANILRGSPVDRTDWKSYILPLMFFKRICDVWDEEYEEAVKTYGEDFDDEHRFVIPEGNHWNDVRETAANVGTALQNAMRGIESANQKHLYGVFGDSQWTNKERLPDAFLKALLDLARDLVNAEKEVPPPKTKTAANPPSPNSSNKPARQTPPSSSNAS
jgi:type I restriction enzyme M protein